MLLEDQIDTCNSDIVDRVHQILESTVRRIHPSQPSAILWNDSLVYIVHKGVILISSTFQPYRNFYVVIDLSSLIFKANHVRILGLILTHCYDVRIEPRIIYSKPSIGHEIDTLDPNLIVVHV